MWENNALTTVNINLKWLISHHQVPCSLVVRHKYLNSPLNHLVTLLLNL